MWMKDIGSKLFNIRSSKINNCKKDEIPETFDSEYYLDQLDPSKRNKFIHVTTQKLERITFKMKKIIYTIEVRTMKKEMMLKITMGRTMRRIIEKFHWMFQQKKCFLQKRQDYSVQCLRSKTPKNSWFWRSICIIYQMFHIRQYFIMTPPPSHRHTHS